MRIAVLTRHFNAQKMSEGFTHHRAPIRQRMRGRIGVDRLNDLRFVAREYRPDGRPFTVPGRCVAGPLLQLGQFRLDFQSNLLVPLLLFGLAAR